MVLDDNLSYKSNLYNRDSGTLTRKKRRRVRVNGVSFITILMPIPFLIVVGEPSVPLDSRSSNDPEHTTERGHTLQATSQQDQQDEGEHVKSHPWWPCL